MYEFGFAAWGVSDGYNIAIMDWTRPDFGSPATIGSVRVVYLDPETRTAVMHYIVHPEALLPDYASPGAEYTKNWLRYGVMALTADILCAPNE